MGYGRDAIYRVSTKKGYRQRKMEMTSERIRQFVIRPSLKERAKALNLSLSKFEMSDTNPFYQDSEDSDYVNFHSILTQLGGILDDSAPVNLLPNLKSRLITLKSNQAAVQNKDLITQINELSELLSFFEAASELQIIFREHFFTEDLVASHGDKLNKKPKHSETSNILKKMTSSLKVELTEEEKNHLETQLNRKDAPEGFTKPSEKEIFTKNAPTVLAIIQKLQAVESPRPQARNVDEPEKLPANLKEQNEKTTIVSISSIDEIVSDDNKEPEESEEDEELEELAADLEKDPDLPLSETHERLFDHRDFQPKTVRQAFETACATNGYRILPEATPEYCVAQVPKDSGDGEGSLSYRKITETTHQLSFAGEADNPYIPIAKVMVEIMILQGMTCVRTNLNKVSPEFAKFQSAFQAAREKHSEPLQAIAVDEVIRPPHSLGA